MREERSHVPGLRLVAAVICIIILVLAGVVFADTPVNDSTGNLTTGSTNNNKSLQVSPGITPGITSQTTTLVPTGTIVQENITNVKIPPPLVIISTPVVENFTSTVYGAVTPGSLNATILSIRWDWGDNHTPEFHGFPYSHVYAGPGTYTLSITALQSDGQNSTKTASIILLQPAIQSTFPPTFNATPPGVPGGPAIPAGAPVLTLLEPVTDRLNVTLNGNLNPGSPAVTIESVTADWNDGNITKSIDLPMTHRYSAPGFFTIIITGNQSDGQSTTKKIMLELKGESPVFPGPASSGPPQTDTPVYLIILATAVIVIGAVAITQRFTQRRRESHKHPDILNELSPRPGPSPEKMPSQKDLEMICSGTGVTPVVLESVIRVAMEIGREGREGQAIGTSFVVGDTENVMNHSKQFVLNPFQGHYEIDRQITDAGIKGNIKEFAQLDGAFLVTDTGVVEAAGRCITVDMSQVDIPSGLGSRHSSAAGITQVTKSIGVVVSQSGGLVSIFRDGKIVYTINS